MVVPHEPLLAALLIGSMDALDKVPADRLIWFRRVDLLRFRSGRIEYREFQPVRRCEMNLAVVKDDTLVGKSGNYPAVQLLLKLQVARQHQ
jgi:hypothetical protein